MRRVMKRKRQIIHACNERRTEFRQSFARCMVPACAERRFFFLACHEIANGPARQAALMRPELWLCLCWPHHEQLHRENWTPERQIGLRKLWFPADDSRAAYLEVTGYAETYLDEEGIWNWSKEWSKSQ